MHKYDTDTARRRLDFSSMVLDAILDKPFNLCLEWLLEQIGRPVAVNRIAYLRSGHDMHELFLAAGFGSHLPLVSSRQVQITPDQLSMLKSGGWIWTPTEEIGWDALFSFRSNGQLGVIAIDDTSSKRIFTEADQEFLIHAARWFGRCYAARADIDHEKRRATMDSLTKMPNQRTVIEKLKETIDNVLSGRLQTATVTLLDIDNFKSVNDTYGHPFGDAVLIALAEILKSAPDVFAGRYGGEEFMIITDSGLQEAVGLVESLHEKFKTTVFPQTAKPYSGSFSAGVYEICSNRLQSRDTKVCADFCYQQADELMYRAKHAGKAQICAL